MSTQSPGLNMVEGTPFTIRGKEYIIPSLSFGQIETLTPELDRLAQIGKIKQLNPQIIKDITKVSLAAISRNYPEINEAYFKENMLDLSNFGPIFDAVMGNSGFQKVKTEIPTTAGE